MERDSLPEVFRAPERYKKEIKYGLTQRQKEWIKEAYIEAYGSLFCVFPKINPSTGESEFCGKKDVEIHHIIPQGWCKRVLEIDPNFPENCSPICTEHHRIGQKDRPLDREHQECIHIDAAWASKNYRGPKKPTSYDKVMEQRRQLTSNMIPYWFEKWDEYLLELSIDTMAYFKEKYPDYPFPERK